jgi:hypothetical protein
MKKNVITDSSKHSLAGFAALYMNFAYMVINILVVLALKLLLIPEYTTGGGRTDIAKKQVGWQGEINLHFLFL